MNPHQDLSRARSAAHPAAIPATAGHPQPPAADRSAGSPSPGGNSGSREAGSFHARYVITGLVMGGMWAYNHGASLEEHALKLLAVVAIVPPLLHSLRARRRRRTKDAREPKPSLFRLVLFKLCIVALALLVTWLLRDRVPWTDYWVAGGITVTVALVGPLLHPFLLADRSPGNGEHAP